MHGCTRALFGTHSFPVPLRLTGAPQTAPVLVVNGIDLGASAAGLGRALVHFFGREQQQIDVVHAAVPGHVDHADFRGGLVGSRRARRATDRATGDCGLPAQKAPSRAASNWRGSVAGGARRSGCASTCPSTGWCRAGCVRIADNVSQRTTKVEGMVRVLLRLSVVVGEVPTAGPTPCVLAALGSTGGSRSPLGLGPSL